MTTPATEGIRAARLDDNRRERLRNFAIVNLGMKERVDLIQMVVNRLTDDELASYDPRIANERSLVMAMTHDGLRQRTWDDLEAMDKADVISMYVTCMDEEDLEAVRRQLLEEIDRT